MSTGSTKHRLKCEVWVGEEWPVHPLKEKRDMWSVPVTDRNFKQTLDYWSTNTLQLCSALWKSRLFFFQYQLINLKPKSKSHKFEFWFLTSSSLVDLFKPSNPTKKQTNKSPQCHNPVVSHCRGQYSVVLIFKDTTETFQSSKRLKSWSYRCDRWEGCKQHTQLLGIRDCRDFKIPETSFFGKLFGQFSPHHMI